MITPITSPQLRGVLVLVSSSHCFFSRATSNASLAPTKYSKPGLTSLDARSTLKPEDLQPGVQLSRSIEQSLTVKSTNLASFEMRRTKMFLLNGDYKWQKKRPEVL